MCTRTFQCANSRSFLASPNQCDPGASQSETIGIQGIQEAELAGSKKDSMQPLLPRSNDTKSVHTNSTWDIFGKSSVGKVVGVSRGGATRELQACPSRAKAHEVGSGGSYSASKRTQIPFTAASRLPESNRTPIHTSKNPASLSESRGARTNAERRSTTTREGLSLVGAPPPQSSAGNDQEANPTARGQRLLWHQSHLRQLC